MSHHSRYGSRSVDRSYYGNRINREQSWNTERERYGPSIRGKNLNRHNRGYHKPYRRPQDEEIVLIRRDGQREDRKEKETPHETLELEKQKEIQPTTSTTCVPRSPFPAKSDVPVPPIIRKNNQHEKIKRPDTTKIDSGSRGKVYADGGIHFTSKLSVPPVHQGIFYQTPPQSSQQSVPPVHQGIFYPTLPPQSSQLSVPPVHKGTFYPPLPQSSNLSIPPVHQGTFYPTLPPQPSKLSVPPVHQGIFDPTLPHPVINQKQNSSQKLDPMQQEMINTCFSNCKSGGDYDKIRRKCMLDIDTKPAYANARDTVKCITERFLKTIRYHPNMDKAKMRENLKKSFKISKSFEARVESLINQTLLPKITGLVLPIVETEVYKYFDDKQANMQMKNESSSVLANNDDVQMINGITHASVTCLPPMNEILDYKPALPKQTIVKFKMDEITPNCADEQLQTEIQKDLNTENAIADQLKKPKVEHTMGKPILYDSNESMDVFAGSQRVKILVDNIENDDDYGEHTIEPSKTNYSYEDLESQVSETTNCGVKKTDIGEIKALSTNETGDNDINSQLVNDGYEQLSLNVDKTFEEDCTVENNDNTDDDEIIEEEEDSDEESPEFEKMGDVSPVRVDAFPDFEFIACDTIAPQPCPLQEEECAFNYSDNTETRSRECVSDALSKQLCKYLVSSDLPNYDRKRLFFKFVDELPPDKRKNV